MTTTIEGEAMTPDPDKVFAVMDALVSFLEPKDEATLFAEAAQEGVPASEASRLLAEWCADGRVVKDGQGRYYYPSGND